MVILMLIPKLDIVISKFFYNTEAGFLYKHNTVVLLFFKIIPIATKFFVSICTIYTFYTLIRYKTIKRTIHSWAFFLLITAAIGPGLSVNSLLKENFGRARPCHILEFSGEKTFSPAFVITNQCKKNCSFSSGHAAMSFYFTAIAYVANSLNFTRTYLAGIVFGTMIGLSRIIMGGHFASDVIASCFIVLLSNHLIYLIWKKEKSEQIK